LVRQALELALQAACWIRIGNEGSKKIWDKLWQYRLLKHVEEELAIQAANEYLKRIGNTGN